MKPTPMAYNPWLHRFCVLLWVSTLILVMAGATVVSKEAGPSVPDWPLSYGKVMPEMTGGVLYEHGHRMIATAVGFLIIILAVWLWRSDSRSGMKRLGFYALLWVIAQGVFGGLTVLFLLPKPVSVAHACTAQLFFSLTVVIALFTSEGWLRGPEIVEDSGTPSARSLAILLPLSVLAQIALGAAYRHKAFNIIPHIVGALVVAAIVIYTGIVLSTSFAGHRRLREPGGDRRQPAAGYVDGLADGAARRGRGSDHVGQPDHVNSDSAERPYSGDPRWKVGGKLMRDYIELTKPRITWLILMSTGIGYFFGRGGGALDWLALFNTILGTALIASGTAALNQWYERSADAKMRRTNQRPIPSGRVSPERALVFGIALSIAGFTGLAWGVNLLTALLGLITLLSYLFLYTPLKRKSRHSTTVGAIPGAMPPLIGFAASAGTLTVEAWVLYAILFLWQFPHFYPIAWMYRDDYARAGIRMLPVVEPDGESTARRILLFSLLLIPVSLLPSYFPMAGKLYLIGALAAGLSFLWVCSKVVRERTLVRARGVLLASVIYLPVLFGLLLLDRPAL